MPGCLCDLGWLPLPQSDLPSKDERGRLDKHADKLLFYRTSAHREDINAPQPVIDSSPSAAQRLTGPAPRLLKPPPESAVESGVQAPTCEVGEVEICCLGSGASSRREKSVLQAGVNPFQLGLQQERAQFHAFRSGLSYSSCPGPCFKSPS